MSICGGYPEGVTPRDIDALADELYDVDHWFRCDRCYELREMEELSRCVPMPHIGIHVYRMYCVGCSEVNGGTE